MDFKDTFSRACLQWGGWTDLVELTEFYNSSERPISVLNTQGWEWRSSALHSPKGTLGSPPWMDAIGMQDIRAMTTLCPYCMNAFGGWEWPIRCHNPSRPAHIAYNMRAAYPRLLYTLSWPPTPLDLLHVDFTSIVTTLELNKSPKVANIVVFQDHFMKHVLAYVTPDQTAKTVANFLYQGYISILGPQPGSWVTEVLTLWAVSLMKCPRSLAWRNYGPCLNTHRLMGWWRDHTKTIMRMIRKLGKDKKADWPGHLAEIVHTYNATCSAMTWYSPHYLMFGWRPRLPVNFYFPTFRNPEAPMREASTKCVDEYGATVHDQLRTALREAQAQLTAEAWWQKWYYDQKMGTMDLKPGNLVLVKADAFKRKRKIRDRWEDEVCAVVHQIATDVLFYAGIDQYGQSCILHWNWLLYSSCQRLAFPCV